jgi:hypothetical protein
MFYLIPFAKAAADADVIALATTTATTLKDNILGALTEVLPIALLVGASIVVVYFSWKFVKRMINGR